MRQDGRERVPLPSITPQVFDLTDAATFGWTSEVNAPALARIRESHRELARVETRSAAEWAGARQEASVRVRSNREMRDMNIKMRAGEIIKATRTSTVNCVMPLTLQDMRRLLPLLTDARYHDAERNEETNTPPVFDSEARRQVPKHVFSGGARDQIMLSLRLALALATPPGEYSTRQGWLFLDEPLSSFDRERTQHLVDLLARGLVREQFA